MTTINSQKRGKRMLMTVTEASKYLRCNKNRIYELIKKNELRAFKVDGSTTLIKQEWIDDYVERHS